jgi:hypothetical protein
MMWEKKFRVNGGTYQGKNNVSERGLEKLDDLISNIIQSIRSAPSMMICSLADLQP